MGVAHERALGVSVLLLVEALHQALRLVLILCLPPLGAVLFVGVLQEGLRLSTKIGDPSIAAILRMAAAALALATSGPWIFAQVSRFSLSVLALLTRPA